MNQRLSARRFIWRAVVPLLLLIGFLVCFELTDADLMLQDHFYNVSTGHWWIDAKEPVGRALFYNGPKALLWIVGLTTIVFAAGPARWRVGWGLSRPALALALLSLATIPLLAGLGKRSIGLHCPSDLVRYGGNAPCEKLFSPRATTSQPDKRSGCFPAGHASGGFALWGLISLRNDRRWRRLVIATGLGLGWWMGGYQMLKGAHFISHTLVTLLLAWLVVLIWRQILGASPLLHAHDNPASASTYANASS